jgi:hypothetical protein
VESKGLSCVRDGVRVGAEDGGVGVAIEDGEGEGEGDDDGEGVGEGEGEGTDVERYDCGG